MTPSSFYKYCPVFQDDDFSKEYSVKNLVNNHVTFTTRKNFNDLFDTKIDLIPPDRNQLKKLAASLSASKRADFKKDFLGDDWREKLERYTRLLNSKFDSYLFYCVTTKSDSNLMWSHYANSHKGFCIEWDANAVKAEKVTYSDNIAELRIIEALSLYWKEKCPSSLEEALKRAFLTKLKEWCYESEYRFHLGAAMEHLIAERNPQYTLVKFQPSWIKSIIWGCRTSEKTKEYIRGNLGFDVRYREAQEGKNKILIRDLD